MSNKWPFAGDSIVTRARRVAHAYRAALEKLDPVACAELDKRFCAWGETWATPLALTVGPDDWLTAADAGRLAGVSAHAIRQLHRRNRLPGRLNRETGRLEFQVKEIYGVFSRTRGRRPRGSDTLHASGSTVPTGDRP